jgi:predicted O-methyltransferase YrrM
MIAGRKSDVTRTVRRAINRAQEFAFPLSSGLRAVRIDDVIAPTNRTALEIEDWTGDPGAGSFWDLTAILLIARHLQPGRVFEIGTGHGRTTLNLALNTPPDAKIYTLDISDAEVVGKLFAKHTAAQKIQRIIADSSTYDFSKFAKQFELVLVDGNHSYEGVKIDTAAAFELVAPGGIVLWDDVHPTFSGVVRALKERPESVKIRRIAGTKLAVYQN